MPLFEPVIRALRPTCEGIFAVVQFVFMGLSPKFSPLCH
jgi:hypothetical protein